MPDFGTATAENFLIDLPGEKIAYPPLPWSCAAARMINLYFEVRKDVLLPRLPREFGRTSPPYCRLFIFDVPESPVGPFRDATLALGCRLNMMPAAFVAASLTNSPEVLAAGLFERGYPTALGRIEFETDGTKARATLSDDRGVLLEVTLPLLQTIEPSRLAYDHVDAYRTTSTENGPQAELMVTAPDLTIEHAAICKNARLEYPSERPESTWQILNNRNVVSAQMVRGTRTFAPAHLPR